tara:strand:+ start:367 stop:1419 length:1053 start_codon:yes stop_codon:yes gene_type:complete
MQTYKFHHAQQLIREDIRDDRISNIAKFLKDTDDPKFLNSVETLIKEEGLIRRINQMWDDAGFVPKYKQPFADLLINSKGTLLSKIQLLFHISNREGSQLMTASDFKSNWNGNIDDKIGNKITTNETFNLMKTRLISDNAFRGQRVGAGEFFCCLFGKNGKKKKEKEGGGDIEIDGHGLELKGGGGLMRTHDSTKFRMSDELRMELKKKLKMPPVEGSKGYFKPAKANDPHVIEIKKLSGKDQLNIINWYLSRLYPKFPPPWIKDIAKDWQKNIGTSKIFEKFGSYNLLYYQQTDKWDSIMLIRETDGFCVNISDVKTASKQPITFSVNYNRGGDTNAVPDGSGKVHLSK